MNWLRNCHVSTPSRGKNVMDEKLVQNGVMNEILAKNFVMDAKSIRRLGWICPYSKLVDGTVCNPSIKNCCKSENEPWLLIVTPSRDPFLVTQYLERHSVSQDQHMKKLMSLREGLIVLMQSYMRQHFAVRYWLHPGGHASWREPSMRKFTKESTT